MTHELQDRFEANIADEIEARELETIATAVQVQTGIRAGRSIQPCL